MTTKTNKTKSPSIPTGPLAPPLARLIKRRKGGVIGFPWMEIVHIICIPSTTQNFHGGLRYFCRVPVVGTDEVSYMWFTDEDINGNGWEWGEYEPMADPAVRAKVKAHDTRARAKARAQQSREWRAEQSRTALFKKEE